VEVAFLGIDIGGTNVRVSVFRSLDDIEPIRTERFAVKHDYEQDFDQLQKTCRLIRPTDRLFEGIGIALAGVIDHEQAVLVNSGEKTAQWIGQPFAKVLNGIFECPIIMGNDAESAALAEAHYGNPTGQDFWLVIWGTGVGATLVRYINGHPVAFPGEMGHLQVSESPARICDCHATACLEAYCGGKMIEKYVGPPEHLSVAEWGEVLRYMTIGVKAVVTSQPVSTVYFSGGIAVKQAGLIEKMEIALMREILIIDPPHLELSRFGESAGTVGALAMLKHSLG
jgi:glucokinase